MDRGCRIFFFFATWGYSMRFGKLRIRFILRPLSESSRIVVGAFSSCEREKKRKGEGKKRVFHFSDCRSQSDRNTLNLSQFVYHSLQTKRWPPLQAFNRIHFGIYFHFSKFKDCNKNSIIYKRFKQKSFIGLQHIKLIFFS